MVTFWLSPIRPPAHVCNVWSPAANGSGFSVGIVNVGEALPDSSIKRPTIGPSPDANSTVPVTESFQAIHPATPTANSITAALAATIAAETTF